MKNEVYSPRTLLAGSTTFLNQRTIFIKDHLPKFDRDIQTEASKPNLVTTTRNAEVRVFCEKAKKTCTVYWNQKFANVERLGSTSGST